MTSYTSSSKYLEQFNYQLYGPPEGRKWVFLHGLMGYGSNWRKITSSLEKTENVLVYDQRGHGRSIKPVTGYASEDYADDLYLITQDLGWEKFILVGHSLGGRNALVFTHKWPEKVEKLIIEDIGPDPNPEAIPFYQKMLDSVPTPFASKLAAKEFFMNDFPKSGIIHENIKTLGQYLYSSIEELPDGRADFRFSKQAMMASVIQGRAKDHWNELRTLSVPTLVIRGENSKELTRETFQRVIVSNPRIQGVEIPNAGHWVHADQPSSFLKAIFDFCGHSV